MIAGYFNNESFYILGEKHPIMRFKGFELKDRMDFMPLENGFYRFRTKEELIETAKKLDANVIASGAGIDVGSYFYFFKKCGIERIDEDGKSIDLLIDGAGKQGLKRVVAGNVVLI